MTALLLICMDKIKERELQHELATAVTREVEYRRIDDMKKRAIHSAASYDEFKNLVACANLQPVSRSDLESLGKTARGVRNSTASSRTSRRGRGRVTAALSTEPRAATSTQDLATVWRRCGLDFSSKMRYAAFSSMSLVLRSTLQNSGADHGSSTRQFCSTWS